MNKMADIPDAEYITVNANGIFVGGKPATTRYRGVIIYDIHYVNYVKKIFAWMQEQNPNITELHVLSSETSGEYAMVGNPSTEHGPNAWCRVKMKGGTVGGWVFGGTYKSATFVACYASDCAYYVWSDSAFRHAVLVTAFDNGQNGGNAQSDDLGRIDWSQKLGVHNVGPYEIIVKKVGPNTK